MMIMRSNNRKGLTLLFLMLTISTFAWGADITDVTGLTGINGSSDTFVIKNDIDVSNGFSTIASFSGTLEADINPQTHMPYRIMNLGVPLFTTLTGTVRNLVLEDVNISGNTGNTGAIACEASGDNARIYNVGILSGSVGGTGNTGGLVGKSAIKPASSTVTVLPQSPAAPP